MSFYRKDNVGDPEVFAAGLIAVMSLYPAHVLREVVSPTDGLPSRMPFLPSIAEVKQSCEGVCIRLAAQERAAQQVQPDHAANPVDPERGHAILKSVADEMRRRSAEAGLEPIS